MENWKLKPRPAAATLDCKLWDAEFGITFCLTLYLNYTSINDVHEQGHHCTWRSILRYKSAGLLVSGISCRSYPNSTTPTTRWDWRHSLQWLSARWVLLFIHIQISYPIRQILPISFQLLLTLFTASATVYSDEEYLNFIETIERCNATYERSIAKAYCIYRANSTMLMDTVEQTPDFSNDTERAAWELEDRWVENRCSVFISLIHGGHFYNFTSFTSSLNFNDRQAGQNVPTAGIQARICNHPQNFGHWVNLGQPNDILFLWDQSNGSPMRKVTSKLDQ